MRIEPVSSLRVDNDNPERKRQDLEQASREFEALLMAEVLQNLSDSVAGSSEADGADGQLEGVLWLEMARQLTAQRQLGLAEAIYRQLSPDGGAAVGASAPSLPGAPDGGTLSGVERTKSSGLPVAANISSPFGYRSDPFDHAPRFHHGVDLAAAEGATVKAPQSGQVVFAGAQPGYGNVVVVEHAGGIRTLYAHLSRIDVQSGGALQRGEPLGAVGSTGRATGAHLHFEVRRGDVPIDPEAWLGSG